MQINRQPFGTIETGEKVDLFILTNDKGCSVKLTNYGGIITDIQVPDSKDKLTHVVLGFDRLEDYQSDEYKKSKPYFGAIVGRYANRINCGMFSIGDQTYQVPSNFEKYSLHGGLEGFDRKVWKADTIQMDNKVTVKLSYTSKHLEEGFPGNLDVSVTYSWNNDNELQITYLASTDLATHLNLTNHSYFNLNGGKGDVLDNQVWIDADSYTEVDEDSLPTGGYVEVDEACMDFRTPRSIGERIERAVVYGYDHNYVLNNFDGSLNRIAEAFDKSSGIKLEVLTTEPGMQLYTANHLDGSLSRDDVIFSKYSALCFETQHFPDSPNHPGFPSTLLNPGEKFHSKTVYKFSNQ